MCQVKWVFLKRIFYVGSLTLRNVPCFKNPHLTSFDKELCVYRNNRLHQILTVLGTYETKKLGVILFKVNGFEFVFHVLNIFENKSGMSYENYNARSIV